MPAHNQSEVDDSITRCPVCEKSFSGNDNNFLMCSSCGNEFPSILDRVPVLVHKPQHYLVGERQLIENDAAQHFATGQFYLQAAEEAGIRRETLQQLGNGCLQNSHLLSALAKSLLEANIETEDHGLSLGADLFASIRKDWSGLPETEAEIEVAMQAILDVLSQVPPERTLVLGAGAGRALCEIDARFPGAVGIDLSSAMATAFSLLDQQQELTAYMLHRGNFLRANDEAELIHAHRELAAGSPQYIVADASALPFHDGSFDAVVSNYFTDMLPLSQWLPEARRVLKPDGQFVHFGPLGYVFGEIAEHYALDQLPAAFRQHGMEMSEPTFVRNSFYGSHNRLNRFDLDNILLTATRIENSDLKA